jgi:ribosomal protein L11 methyltransferase
MTWIELQIDTTPEAVDWVSTLLATVDYRGDMQINRLERSPNEPDSDWAFTIRLYLPDDAQAYSSIQEIANRLSSLHRTGLTTELQTTVVENKPSSADESQSLMRHRIGQRFVVLSPDSPYQATDNEIPIILKPSLAFGSGLHPATRLSLQLLERYVMPAMKTLDLGSGSGILSVAMAKLGATVMALDNDRAAVQATQDAADRNRVGQQVTVMEGSLGQGSNLGHWMGGEVSEAVPAIAPAGHFDLIAANILARMHIALADDFRQALHRTSPHNGILITAGFTADYQAEVAAALNKVGFEAIDRAELDDWVALAHQIDA